MQILIQSRVNQVRIRLGQDNQSFIDISNLDGSKSLSGNLNPAHHNAYKCQVDHRQVVLCLLLPPDQ